MLSQIRPRHPWTTMRLALAGEQLAPQLTARHGAW
jgi:hypothetical protein